MRRFLCLVLCLGVMASACKKKKAAPAAAVTPKTKDAVIKDCLPLIETQLKDYYNDNTNIAFRAATTHAPSITNPIVFVYGPAEATNSWTKAGGWEGRNTIAENVSLQGRFIAEGTGYKVHISSTPGNDAAIAANATAPTNFTIIGMPASHSEIAASGAASSDTNAAWYTCVVNASTQAVTVTRAVAPTTGM